MSLPKLKFNTAVDIDFKNEINEKVKNYVKETKVARSHSLQVFLEYIIFFAVFIALYCTLAFKVHSLFVSFIILCGIGISLLSLLARFGHEFGHGSILKNQSLNNFFYILTFELAGIDHVLWKITHNQIHHPKPNIPSYDGDINGNTVLRMGPHEEHKPIQKYMHLYAPFLYSLFFLNKFFVKDFFTLKKLRIEYFGTDKTYNKQLVFMCTRKMIYLFLMIGVPYIFLPYNFLTIFLTFISFHFITSIIIGFILGGSHSSLLNTFHCADSNGNISTSYFRHQIETAVDFNAQSRIFNFLYGSTNAHIAHHLFPTMTSYHYPYVSKIIKETCEKYNIQYNDLSFTDYCFGHWKYLKASALNTNQFKNILIQTEKQTK